MTIGVAIVGAGWMGGVHADAVGAGGDRVAAVVDPNADRAGQLADTHDAIAVPDIVALDADHIDVAIVTTPTSDHAATTRQLLDEGIAVLVEKPHRRPADPAFVVADDDPLCWVGMTTRYHDGMQMLSESVLGGELGEVRWWSDRIWFALQPGALPPWYFDPAVSGGGVLTTNGVHALDRARWILGPLRDARADSRRLFDDHAVEDAAHVTALAGDAVVDISLVWGTGTLAPSGTTVIGTAGTVNLSTGTGWRVSTANGTRSGDEPDAPVHFERQWRSFRAALERDVEPGDPTVAALEPTMVAIETLYEQLGRSEQPERNEQPGRYQQLDEKGSVR